MSASALREILVSPEEYLAAEDLAVEKHEYFNGVVHAMSGVSYAHAVIGANIGALLHGQLRGKPCRPLGSDMKLRISRGDDRRFYYPDLMVVCQPRQGSVWQDMPVVLAEVLSPSTRRTDLGEKREAYFSIPTLRHYVLFDSEKVEAIAWSRADEMVEWKAEAHRGSAGVVNLPAVRCRLLLAEVYEDSGLR